MIADHDAIEKQARPTGSLMPRNSARIRET
jgi:hypothetical protein